MILFLYYLDLIILILLLAVLIEIAMGICKQIKFNLFSAMMVAPRRSLRVREQPVKSAAPSSNRQDVQRTKRRAPTKAKKGGAKKRCLNEGASSSAPPADIATPALTIRRAEPRLDGMPPEILTRILRYCGVRDRLSVRGTNRELECRVAETDLYCKGMFMLQKYGAFRWATIGHDDGSYLYQESLPEFRDKNWIKNAIVISEDVSKAVRVERFRGRLFARAHFNHVFFNFDTLDKKGMKLIESILDGCTYKQIRVNGDMYDTERWITMRSFLQKYENNEAHGFHIYVNSFLLTRRIPILRSFNRPIAFLTKSHDMTAEMVLEMARRGDTLMSPTVDFPSKKYIFDLLRIVASATVPQEICTTTPDNLGVHLVRRSIGASLGLRFRGGNVVNVNPAMSKYPDIDVVLRRDRNNLAEGGDFDLILKGARLMFRSSVRAHFLQCRIMISNDVNGRQDW
ncbi:hypothetical protein PFISCL1PPCAC_20718 [Pristionchus fissidentatus]|uniref:F-box domain-containing protein n=1 Tax=Pristionchus fissidentatus TaxID=1538716 RepID=A0AAV5WEW3_9BILA|nr:hypothetical protein PFISCL1PPCAC_20718 [Pristionchus fissidentatus]